MSRGRVRDKPSIAEILTVGVMAIVGSFVLKGTGEPFTLFDALVGGVAFSICVVVLVLEAKTWAKVVAVTSVVILSYLFFH